MKRACLLSPCNWMAAVLVLSCASAWPQITSSPNVVGSGARALGMGGAFIAVADDATSASWNPGGLTQLERPEFSAVYNFSWYTEDFTSSTHPELGGAYDVDFDQINYLSFVYPIPKTIGGRNLVLSMNYQRKFDFDRNLRLKYNDWLGIVSNGQAIPVIRNSAIEYSQRGSLGTLSPAFGFEVTDRLSLGLVWNIWDSSVVPDNEWKERQTQLSHISIGGRYLGFTKSTTTYDYDDIKGSNYSLGALYRVSERWNVGLVYHTKFNASMNFTQTNSVWPFLGTRSSRSLEYQFPSALGLGLSYRFPNDKLTLSLDLTRREWDQFIIFDPENPMASQQKRSAVTQLPKKNSPHDPTYTVRFGAEYVFVNASKPKQDYLPSLRAGIFYDPEPSGGRSTLGVGLKRKGDGSVEDFYGFTLGAGVLIKNVVNLDAAYVYRWGDNARKDTFGQFNITRTDASVDQHTFYVSTVVYFQ